MKTLICRLSSSAAVLLGLIAPAAAQPVSPPPPTRGRVLVFQTERTLSGDVERVGDQYRIRRLLGETWIPADQVLRLCGSLEEAYELLRNRANLNDPDEHIRLGEWCRQHGLPRQAIQEVREASHLRPHDARLKRILAHLESTPAPPSAATAAAPPAESAPPRVEVSAEAVSQYTVRVQPILMNACVRCHHAGRGGQFQLTRVSGTGSGDRRTTEQNLAAVLDEINPRQPAMSRLLLKSITIHGRDMGQAPLTGRDAVAYRTLEQWVSRTVADNPQMLDRAVAAGTAPPAHAGQQATAASGQPWGADREAVGPKRPEPLAVAKPAPSPPPSEVVKPAPSPPKAPAAASPDPVDPDAFNREFHPPPKGAPPARVGQGNGA